MNSAADEVADVNARTARLQATAVNADVPSAILAAFSVAVYRAGQHLPYVTAGGHDDAHPFQPSKDPEAPADSPKGYDCSGAASDVWNRIVPLGHALSTRELVTQGLPGEGRFFTMWVAQYDGILEHVACEFKIPSHPTLRWYVAAHHGTIVGFFSYTDDWVHQRPFVYTPRRRP